MRKKKTCNRSKLGTITKAKKINKKSTIEQELSEIKKSITDLNNRLNSINDNNLVVTDNPNTNPFFDYEEYIDNIDFNKTSSGEVIPPNQRISPKLAPILRDMLRKLITATKVVGKVVIEYGKKVLDFIIQAIQAYPNIATGLLIIAILHALKNICLGPILGFLANTVLIPIDICVLAISVVREIIGKETFNKLIKNIAATASL